MLLSRSVVFAVAAVNGILLARALGPAGKGAVAALLVYPMLLVTIAEAGVSQATVLLVGTGTHARERVHQSVLFLLLVGSAAGVALCAAAFRILDPGDYPLVMMGVVLLTVPLRLAISYSNGILLANQRVERFVRVRSLTTLVQLVLICVLVLGLGMGMLGATLALVLSAAPVAVYALWLLREFGPLRIRAHAAVVKDLLRLGAVYSAGMFLLTLTYRVDVVLLSRMGTLSELGQYTAAVPLAELVWEVPTAIGVLIFSRRAGTRDGRRFTEGVLRLARVALVAAVIAALLMAWGATIGVPLLYGEAFRPSILLIQLILPGTVAFSLFKLLHADLSGKGRPGVAVMVMAPVVLLNVALNLVWIPRWGGPGAALASTVSYVTATAFLVIVYCRIVQVPLREAVRYRRSDFAFLAPLLAGRPRKAA